MGVVYVSAEVALVPQWTRKMNADRRDFLRLMSTAAMAVPLGGPEPSRESPHAKLPDRTVDVAIVGAGLAGLTAVRELVKNGMSVCVLEARDRVGGRTLDHPIGGGDVVEGGWQWTGPGQTRVLALAKELGIATFPSYYEGKIVLSISGLRFTRPGDEADSANVKRVKKFLDGLAKTVPPDAPWSAEHARMWDDKTVAEWLAENTGDEETKQVFEIDISTELGSPSRISLLYYLFIIRSAGGLQALATDAQERRFVGGPQSLSKVPRDPWPTNWSSARPCTESRTIRSRRLKSNRND